MERDRVGRRDKVLTFKMDAGGVRSGGLLSSEHYGCDCIQSQHHIQVVLCCVSQMALGVAGGGLWWGRNVMGREAVGGGRWNSVEGKSRENAIQIAIADIIILLLS